MATHRVMMNPEGLRRKVPGMPMSFYRARKPEIPKVKLDFNEIATSSATVFSLDFESLEQASRQRRWTQLLVEMVAREATK
jgi:hypothetical protein